MMTPVLMARVLTHAMAIREASYTVWVDREINPEREGISPMDVPNYNPNRPLWRQKDGRQTQEHGYYTIDENKAISLALDAYQLSRQFTEPLAQLLYVGYSELESWCDDVLNPDPTEQEDNGITIFDMEGRDEDGNPVTITYRGEETTVITNESSPWFQKYQKD